MLITIGFIALILINIPLWFYLSQGMIHFILIQFIRKVENKPSSELIENDFGIIITAHQNTEFLLPIVDSILKQNYSKYHVYIVADECNIEKIDHLRSSQVSIFTPKPALNSKIKSIDFALNNFQRQHNYMIIFDPDNLLHTNYLFELNKYMNYSKFKVVQTRLLPKNINSNIAKLDTLGSSFYDFISRESKHIFGLSSHIYGLGIAIPVKFYKEIKYSSLLGGFDKRIQTVLVRSGYRIGYCKEAVVYDEKTSTEKELQKQRTRWLFAYFKYLKDGFNTILNGIRAVNFDIFYFGIESIRPPIILLLSFSFLLGIIDLTVSKTLFYPWLLFLLIYPISALLILFRDKNNRNILKSVIYTPRFLFIQFLSLFGIKKAKYQFLKTNHYNILYIEDVLESGNREN